MRRDAEGLGPLELAALVGLGMLLAGSAVVVLVGGLAGLLGGGRWTAVSLDEAAGILTRLPHHLGDPRRAWPAAARAGMPGVAGFIAALAAASVAGVVLGLLLLRLVGGKSATHRRPAQWARDRDLRSLRVRPGTGHGRVVVGRRGRLLLAAESRQSVLVVAPTQTGKTTGLAIPAILEWPGPVLATSVKTDLLRSTLGYRRSAGEVRIFDPAAVTGLERASWTPLSQCDTWQNARRTADRLARATQASQQSVKDADFWSQSAARFLAPLMFAAALGRRDMGDVARWIDAEGSEDVLEILQPGKHDAPRNAAIAVWGADDRMRSSLGMTAALAVEAYNDPTVLACSRTEDITPTWLLDGSAKTLYLCAPLDEQARLRPLFATLVREIVAEVYARASATGQPIDPPLLIVLDEAANIAPLPDIDQIASTGAGQGLQLVTVLQDLAQVHDRWGSKADTIVNNHRAKLFGAGTTCARTLDYVSRVLGEAEYRQSSETVGERGRRSTTKSVNHRPLAPANVVRERDPGSLLLLYGNLPPAVVRTRPWYRDRRLRRLGGRHV
jgi:type IV secretion system protein VirD4